MFDVLGFAAKDCLDVRDGTFYSAPFVLLSVKNFLTSIKSFFVPVLLDPCNRCVSGQVAFEEPTPVTTNNCRLIVESKFLGSH